MSRRLIFLIAVGALISGCCRDPGRYAYAPLDKMSGWGTSHEKAFAPSPKRNRVKRLVFIKAHEAPMAKEASPSEDLAKLRPYSKEWGAALDAMNRAADAELKRKLIICKGCLPPEQDDETSSITLKK
jgi:hypothetical protein